MLSLPLPAPTLLPSFISIPSAVFAQYTRVTKNQQPRNKYHAATLSMQRDATRRKCFQLQGQSSLTPWPGLCPWTRWESAPDSHNRSASSPCITTFAHRPLKHGVKGVSWPPLFRVGVKQWFLTPIFVPKPAVGYLLRRHSMQISSFFWVKMQGLSFQDTKDTQCQCSICLPHSSAAVLKWLKVVIERWSTGSRGQPTPLHFWMSRSSNVVWPLTCSRIGLHLFLVLSLLSW